MSITGKGSLSIKKKDLQGQKSGATSFRKVVFAHKAAAGETGIGLSSLTTPSELSSAGFTQPSPALLAAANLKFFRNNLTVLSSARGLLQDYLSYNVSTSMQISFTDSFGPALDGEIFICTIDAVPRNDLVGVDVTSILASGVLLASQTDFNVGKSFKVNSNPSTQIGELAVYEDGLAQFRNSGNATAAPAADGNYQEIDNGSGYGTIIRFNTAEAFDRNILIIGTGISIIRPNGSLVQELELLAGQIDSMVPTLAVLAGVSESTFQTAPNNADLKAFGDSVAKKDVSNAWTAPQPLIGVINGSDALPGEVGEYIESTGPTSGTLVSAVFTNLHSYVLPAGDWDVWGYAVFSVSGGDATTEKLIHGGVSTVSGAFDDPFNDARYYKGLNLVGVRLPLPIRRISTLVPQTLYVVGRMTNIAGTAGTTTVSTPKIIARRIR